MQEFKINISNDNDNDNETETEDKTIEIQIIQDNKTKKETDKTNINNTNSKLSFLNATKDSSSEIQLTNYFKLKQLYDKQRKDFLSSTSKNVFPPCIQCERSVGTIFSRTFDKKKDTVLLRAICGDKKQPCTLKIEIATGKYANLYQGIQELEKQIANHKNKIILWKNDVLFGYQTEDEILERFDIAKKNISDLNFALNNFYTHLHKYGPNNRNWQKQYHEVQEKVDLTIFEIKLFLESTKNMTLIPNKKKEFEKHSSTTTTILHQLNNIDIHNMNNNEDDASYSDYEKLAEAYHRLQPLLSKLRELKYAICYVSKTENQTTTTYDLIQKEQSISDKQMEQLPLKVLSYHFCPKEKTKYIHLQKC